MRLRTRAAATLALTVLGLLVPSVARAAPTPTLVSSPAKQNCVLNLSRGNAVSCYASFTEAITDATDGKLTDAPASAGKAMRDAAFLDRVAAVPAADRGAGALSGTLIAIEWVDIAYSGVAWVFEAGWGCSPSEYDTDFWVNNLYGTWLQDKISSYKAYGNCVANHYEHADFYGLQAGWWPAMWFVGEPMNDKTSSIRWT